MSGPPYPLPSAPGGPAAPNCPGYIPPALALPTSKVEVRVSCRNLRDMDILSKSDPMVVLSVERYNGKEKAWHELGRTEVIKDNLNPDFITPFLLDYRFEEIQKLKFSVYDVDAVTNDLNDQDYLGSCECTLGSLVGENRGKIETDLLNVNKVYGRIILTAEEQSTCREIITLQFRGRKLDKKDFFGLSDPYLVFYRSNEDNSFTAVHKTEVVKKTLNPTWQPFTILARNLCNGDLDRTIKVECYDWDSDGGHDFIGEFTTNARELKEWSGTCSFELVNAKKKRKKKNYKNSGHIDLVESKSETELSFLDYIHNGLELCFSVAIDFTASNGDPSIPSSLHYRSPYEPNQYVQALTAVGYVCQDYDTDKLFPCFGFGARVPPTYEVMHQFSLTGNPDPHCFGIQGILEAYYRSVQVVQLYGPTNFAPVIKGTAAIAAKSVANEPGKKYFVLLILTDGIITDMQQTKEAIVNASSLPMSIIIVGVGAAEFDAMEELDGDIERLSYRGKFAERDIVQFVPFRNYAGKGFGASAALTSEVLAELPEQITSYMKSKGFKP